MFPSSLSQDWAGIGSWFRPGSSLRRALRSFGGWLPQRRFRLPLGSLSHVADDALGGLARRAHRCGETGSFVTATLGLRGQPAHPNERVQLFREGRADACFRNGVAVRIERGARSERRSGRPRRPSAAQVLLEMMARAMDARLTRSTAPLAPLKTKCVTDCSLMSTHSKRECHQVSC